MIMDEWGPMRSAVNLTVIIGVLLWGLVLLYVAYRIPIRPNTEAVFLVGLILCVVIAEWPWRHPGMHIVASAARGVVVVLALLWLEAAMDTYSIVRNGSWERVTEYGGRELTPFLSGVWTMKEAVDKSLAWAGYPIFLLTLQAAVPGVRSLVVAFVGVPQHGSQERVDDASA